MRQQPLRIDADFFCSGQGRRGQLVQKTGRACRGSGRLCRHTCLAAGLRRTNLRKIGRTAFAGLLQQGGVLLNFNLAHDGVGKAKLAAARRHLRELLILHAAKQAKTAALRVFRTGAGGTHRREHLLHHQGFELLRHGLGRRALIGARQTA